MHIIKVPFSSMLTKEIPAIAKKVIAVVGDYDLEELKIQEGYDLLVALKPTIHSIKPYGAHPITTELKPIRKQCILHAQTMSYNMGMVMKKNAGQLTSLMIATDATIKLHLHRLDRSKNETVFITNISNFEYQLTTDLDLSKGLSEFSLMEECNSLLTAYGELQKLLKNRTQSISTRPELKTKGLTQQVRIAMENLFKQIEVNAVINPELDYEPLIRELNETIAEQRVKASKRMKFNKRKAEELETEEESNNESANPTEEAAPMTISLNAETMTGNGFKERFDEQLDKKKTVAMSTKLVQLPSIENKDMKDANPLV